MPSYQTHAVFLHALTAEIQNGYRPPSGAMFTVALIAVEGTGMLFATGKVVFHDEAKEGRGALSYPTMILAEEWVEGVEQSIERLRLLLEGQGSVAGQPVRGRFAGTYSERNVHSFYPRFTAWAEWVFKTGWHHEQPRPALNNDPLVAFGLPPYQSTRSAVSEWVYGRVLAQGSEGPYMNELNTILPDTRARLVDAKWDNEEVVIDVQANCARVDLELHTVFLDSRKQRFESRRAPDAEVRIKVPDDADGLWLSLVHSSAARLGEITLIGAYPSLRAEADSTPLEQQVRRDIAGGENERVEYKPFVKRGDSKEMEVVETVIAFANTHGGRVLLGVDDNGRLMGHGHMTAMLPPNERRHDPHTRLRDWAHKLLSDKCKPVPHFSVHVFAMDGDPVGVIDVQRGQERPYCVQHRNVVFVRKGGSNVIPDPKTEWAAFFGPTAFPGAIFGGHLLNPWPR